MQEVITAAGEIRRLPGPRDQPRGRVIGTLHPALGKTREKYITGIYPDHYAGVTVILPEDFGNWAKGGWEDAPLVREKVVGATLRASGGTSVKTLGELRDSIKKSKYTKRVFFFRFAEDGSDDAKAASARSDAAAAAFTAAVAAAETELKGEPEGL